MATIGTDFHIDTTNSRALSARLERSMPGGDTRTLAYYQPYPLAIVRGSGCRIWDADGNEYVDLLNNYTSTVHGHASPEITEALNRQASLGTVFPAPGKMQAELAERIRERFSSIDKLRFANSGSEAVMIALRGARVFTRREKIVKAVGGYHGMWEQVPASSATDKPGAPRDYGPMLTSEFGQYAVPEGVRALVRMVDYNDAQQLEAVMEEDGDNVAAIILEPVMGTGVISSDFEYMTAARRIADKHGALLVLDEVQTLRLQRGGMQEVLEVRPDLTILGKIIGGGLPVGAFGGRGDIMDVFNPRLPNYIAHSATFNGNALTMVAGCAALDLLTDSEISRINSLGGKLADGLRQVLTTAGLNGAVTNVGSMLNLHFETAGEPRTSSDLHLESPTLARFHLAALEEGVYFAPRGFLNMSTAMDEGVVEEVLDACHRTAERVAALGA